MLNAVGGHPRATSPSSIRVRQVPLHLESPKGAACPGPRLSALRGSSLRETHAHARNPRPHRAFWPLLGSSVAASSSSRREGSVPSSPARSGRPPAEMSTAGPAVGSRVRRRFTGRGIKTGASARRVPTGMGPDRPNTPDCGTPRRGGRRGVERSLGSRWSARVPGPRKMKIENQRSDRRYIARGCPGRAGSRLAGRAGAMRSYFPQELWISPPNENFTPQPPARTFCGKRRARLVLHQSPRHSAKRVGKDTEDGRSESIPGSVWRADAPVSMYRGP